MRKTLVYGSIILTSIITLIIGGIICFRGGINKLEWMDYISIGSMLFLVIIFNKALFNILYYQKKIIDNYRTTYTRFKELHKIRYRMYFSSIDKEKIEETSELLEKYTITLLTLGTEILEDENYPKSYRKEAEEIINNILKLANQIQS